MAQEKNNSKSRIEEAIRKAEERKKARSKRIISEEDVDSYDYDDTDDKFSYNDFVNG